MDLAIVLLVKMVVESTVTSMGIEPNKLGLDCQLSCVQEM